MKSRLLATLILLGIGLVTVGAVVAAMAATPRSGRVVTVAATDTSTPPTVPPTIAPTSTTGPTAVTGQGPSAFTTLRAPGPIQVRAATPACIDAVGDGYTIAYTISNSGPAVTGMIAAAVDDNPGIVQRTLALPAGAAVSGTARIPNQGGDGIVVSFLPDDQATVSSFPIETPGCRTDPADIREAERRTREAHP